MAAEIRAFVTHPLMLRVWWVLFGILFYMTGEAFTVWLLEPSQFEGGVSWLYLALFPVVAPLFFYITPKLGCASGSCSAGGSA